MQRCRSKVGNAGRCLAAVVWVTLCACGPAASLQYKQAFARPRQLLIANSSLVCKRAKPTLFLMSGIGGSQMSGAYNGNSTDCPGIAFTSPSVIWFGDKWVWEKHLNCWGYLMSVQYDNSTGRYQNSSGTELWADQGLPEGSKQKLYYAVVMKHLLDQHGYILGKDLFIISYDWRIGIQGLEQTGGLKKIATHISDGVKENCGQKAIVISHSFGANVMAYMLQKPQSQKWKEANIKGWVPVGGPFGGAAATAWVSLLSGDFFKLFPILSNLLPVSLTSQMPTTVVGKSVYKFAFGLPSWGFMFPRRVAFDKEHAALSPYTHASFCCREGQVVVSTPTKNYTIEDQRQLLLDMGDVHGANLLEHSWNIQEAALQYGPIPGIDTYCLYSTAVPTVVTLMYNQTMQLKHPMRRPYQIGTSRGDGVVDLNSLRLCSKFAPAGHIYEVNGPLVDHSTILSHPVGLFKLSKILNKLGVPNTKQIWLPPLLAPLLPPLSLGK